MEPDEPKPGPSNWRKRSASRNRMRNNNSWRAPDDSNRFEHPNQHEYRSRGLFHFSPLDDPHRVPMHAPNRVQNQEQIRHAARERHNNGSTSARSPNPGYPGRGGLPRGGRGTMRPNHENVRFKYIGFKTLEEIAEADPKDVLQKINEKREAFMKLADSPIESHDMYALFLKIVSKISQTPFIELKSQLILNMCNSNFITHLRNYLMDLPYVENKNKNNYYWKHESEFWKNFITFCGDIVEISPTTALRKCRALIEGISKTCLEGLNQRHGFDKSEELNLKLNEVREKMTNFGDKYQVEGKPKMEEEQNIQPPENFRELSVVPTRDDLLGTKPFLRPNIIKGGYTDVEHYLDVQFRLLREDCYGPFREGINQFLGDPNKRKYDHVRIFHNVKFACPYVTNMKVGCLVQIDMQSNRHFHRINWAHNKRFLFGSLVLFTKDHCSNFMAATILDRDVNLLSSGKLPVSIIDTNYDHSIYNEDTYTMIESEVYFEPYFHVLKALQEPSFTRHLAMQQYIVQVDAVSKHPAYLTENTEFVIKDVKLEDEKNSDDSESDPIDEIFTNDREKFKFKVLQPETWPTREELKFNASQYEAYRLALTHEFAVIQGPPGTGKTFIGIHVAKTLLQNIKTDKECLMLIICYTNHALDQFLEAISKITKSIVRIGGQSRNKAMEQFNLMTLRRANHSHISTHGFYLDQKLILRRSINELQDALMLLDILNNGVVSSEYIWEYTPVIQLLEDYYKHMEIPVEDPLEYWLFETCQDYYTDFNECLTEYDSSLDNEDVIDKKRMEMILDDDDTSKGKGGQDGKKKFSFLLGNAKIEIKALVKKYKSSRDFKEKYLLQMRIQHLNGRINLYNDMVTQRYRELRLNLNQRTNFSVITPQIRWRLYFTWVHNHINEAKEEVARLQGSVSPSIAAYDEARMMMDVQLLKNRKVKVVGMTTSGAARMRKLLQAIAPKIVIVEEAAEVLEQHIITSLTRDCQHLILIGDHQQLRPSASHIKLAKEYNIEVSLFERMITNGIHSRRLNVQHRMRPEIAALISPHIYSDLANHPSVEAYDNVPGIEKNLYFFTHNFKEEVSNDSNSRSNHKEADMTLALANYLMQQGYDPEDITILAAYSGQMFYMRKERQNYPSLSRVQITVVDNYQGEESKIILLSLVRNNPENTIGFLGTENRICVALSRAKQGFYIFGNIEMLKAKSELWRKIAVTLENNGSLGTSLIVKCQNHPDQTRTLSTPEDFVALPPEGGCFEKCNYQYQCGHQCQLYCHGYDRNHFETKCTMKCEKVICDLGHVCPLNCREDCRPCMVKILKTLPCGHEMNIYCHREPEDPLNECLTKIDATLPSCGHKVQKYCYMDVNAVECTEPCVHRLADCGHVCSRRCHVNHDPDHQKYTCVKPCARAKAGCTAELIGDRGDHQCPKPCFEKCDDCHVQVKKKRSTCKHVEPVACCKDINEIPCKKKCTRTLTCGHFCKKKCFEKCGDCEQMVTKTIPECNHQVKVQCMKTVTREFCTEKCTRQLACGHPCKDRCSVICDPAKCTEVSTVEVKSPCGHNITLPCNAAALFAKGDLKPEKMLKYCKVPCGQELACKHLCGGSCAKCHQGRLHQPCNQICNQNNICGHQCQEPCNQICPPCKMMCEVKCPHSHCKKLCCEPCMPCQEKCNRKCEHGACTRRCGEPCDRPPCDLPCGLPLACGHPCRGLCGEPCPPVCRICRPDDFPRDFLGDEYEDDDKFILLQDCDHVLEVENMDNLMLGDQENIQIRKCPFCRKGIINTNRYKDSVNSMFKNDINPIKKKVFGTKPVIMKKMEELEVKVMDKFIPKYGVYVQDHKEFLTIFLKFRVLIKKRINVSLLQVEMQCIYFNIFEMIVECWHKYRTETSETTTLMEELQKCTTILLDALKINTKGNIPIKVSAQQQNDINNEIKRLNIIVQFSKLLDAAKYLKDDARVKECIETTTADVFTLRIFNEDDALVTLNTFQELIKSSGIVSKYEREMIVKAINLRAGNWFKCPNGHLYCIGECGGAVQAGICPDCGARIGGVGYNLMPGNVRA